MRLRTLALSLTLFAACGGDDTGIETDLDARPPTPDAGLDAAIDAPIDAPIGAPVVVITSHTDGQRIAGSRTITLAGTVADPDTITGVTITVGAATPFSATFDQTSWSASVQLGDADNDITVTAIDSTGTSGAAQATIVFPYIALANMPSASLVLGQATFTTGAQRSLDASNLRSPYGQVTELNGVFFASDYTGDRVLAFRGFPAEDGLDADFVLGQTSPTAAVNGGAAADRLDGPQTVASHAGRLYVLEYGNSRITIWPSIPSTNGAPATAVLGQNNLTSSSRVCTATGLNRPEDMIIAGGRLIVADGANNRVLVWNAVPTTTAAAPDLVLGQADFVHCTANDDAQTGIGGTNPTARTMDYPTSVWSDGTRLLVGDGDNHRVLVWNTFPTSSFQPADFVLGQPDAFTGDAGATADRFELPYGIASNGNQLFVVDTENNRVKVWNTFPTSNVVPDALIGQSDFSRVTRNDDNQDGTADATPSARTLFGPSGVTLVRDRLLVTDNGNNRILLFGQPVCTTNAGLYEYPYGSGACIDDPCDPSSVCTNLRTCSRETGVAVCSCPTGITGDCDTCRRYVDPAATGAGTGESWSDAMTSLPPALTASASIGFACEVWVKEGTYYAYTSSDDDTFSVAGSVTVRGGFAGNETTAAGRTGGATILDGRESAAGASDVHHVVSSTSATGTPTLDRLTIRYGNASGTGNNANGGGVYVANSARLALNECVVEHNRANANGGGLMSNAGGGAVLTITDSTFRNNHAGTSGGGAHLANGTVTGSTFENNTVGTALGHGGGGVTLLGTGTMTGAIIRNNSAFADAGGIWIRNGSSAWTISDSQILSNSATNGGGVYFDASGSVSTLRTSLLAGNTATGTGGAFFGRDSSAPIVNVTAVGNTANSGGGLSTDGFGGSFTNVIAWGNTAVSAADVRLNGFNGTVTYSNFGGGVVAGTGNISADPLFTADYHLGAGSPCIDTGTPAGTDMGAYP